MRSAAHVDALNDIFSGKANILTYGLTLAAKIDITLEILHDYNNTLGSNPLFQAWLAACQNQNRIITNDINDAPRKVRGTPIDIRKYAAASYFSGGCLISSNTWPLANRVPALSSIGTKLINVALPPPTDIPGDNPIASINLQHGGNTSFNVLNDYIKPEEIVVVYDKYINAASMELLQNIATLLEPGCTIKVFTTHISNSCLTTAVIIQKLKITNPRITIVCEEVSLAFRKKVHDRYIFCGNRLQISFTRGLDCFGPRNRHGVHSNHLSDVVIHTTNISNILNIETMAGGIHPVFCK